MNHLGTKRLETERLEAERLEAERLEAERLEAERLEAERLEAERLSGARPPLYRRPRCPVCGLPEIKMVERKVPVFFGLFKKTKIVSVCKACGFELI